MVATIIARPVVLRSTTTVNILVYYIDVETEMNVVVLNPLPPPNQALFHHRLIVNQYQGKRGGFI